MSLIPVTEMCANGCLHLDPNEYGVLIGSKFNPPPPGPHPETAEKGQSASTDSRYHSRNGLHSITAATATAICLECCQRGSIR